MIEIEILYCPKCGQGMFIKKECLGEEFQCIDEVCCARLKVECDKDGKIYLIKAKKEVF